MEATKLRELTNELEKQVQTQVDAFLELVGDCNISIDVRHSQLKNIWV